MTNNSPDISFITICYNGFKDTCELIESLHKKLKSVSYEIIVVDNASRENVFAFCCTDANVVTTGKTSVLIAADADNRWV